MAGNHPAFSPTAFRAAIRSAMVMGTPVDSDEAPTFRWSVHRDYSIEDPAGDPYDWTSTPTATNSPADVKVPCAVEFAARPAGSTGTPLGQFDTSRAVITLLDEDYELVKGADLVLLGQNTYVVSFTAPPLGMFDCTVYQLFIDAKDES